MKSKVEPATNRIKRLLEVLIKGKDMILSNFLSRHIEDDSNPHEIIPISFNILEILQERYHSMITDTYKVQTRAQAKGQAKAPTVLDTQPVTQKATPNDVQPPLEMEKPKDVKAQPRGIVQQPSIGIVLPPEYMLPPSVIPPNIRPPPKPPNIDETTKSPI